ncbi:MAG TPA: S1C family serine protease [Candidatus Binatia bacterium]|nr:S1C family serine protease [Candidatus Binatia bacterium]
MDGHVSLLQEVAASTVTVSAEIPPSHPSAGVLGTSRTGTGGVVDEDGTVLTVNYIVLGATQLTVTDTEGNTVPAKIIAQDFTTGVAAVASDLSTVPPLRKGSSTLVEAGQDLFLVSSVGGADRRSASGFVSSTEAFDAYWEYYLERAIWLSAINPGLGGAPLCDARGRLVGVVSLNLGAVGRATLAIPAEHWFDHADELRTHGRRTTRAARAWLGMFCYALPDRTVVAGLVPGAPGERSGLTVGDVIVRIGEEQVTGRLQLYEAIWRHSPGETIALKVFRSGRLAELTIQTGDAEDFFRI